ISWSKRRNIGVDILFADTVSNRLLRRAGNKVILRQSRGMQMVGARLRDHFRNVALGIRNAAVGTCVFAVMAGHAPTPAMANDDCCADLEARVAELEATIVDKGNRKINLELAGAVSRAILFWDDGANSDAYVVTNDGEGSKIEFTGEVEHFYRTNWSAGFHIEINVQGSGSGEVNQFDASIPTELETDESLIWLRHDK